MSRLALIHALAHSVAPINEALARDWPDAVRMNLLDDSLSADLARTGRLDADMTRRFLALADYAVSTGAQAILYTCSAFGPCIEAAALRHVDLPVLKPNEALIDDVAGLSGPVGLLASFEPTLRSMPAEFPPGVELRLGLATGALEALNRGDGPEHDRLVGLAAQGLAAAGCCAIALAQFSLARAREVVLARTGLPVYTTVGSAVARLRHRLGQELA